MRTLIAIGCTYMLSGCMSIIDSVFPLDDVQANQEQMSQTQDGMNNSVREAIPNREYIPDSRDGKVVTAAPRAVWATPRNVYSPAYSHKNLSDYAEQLSMELFKNGRHIMSDSRIGVASFVEFDRTLRNSSPLGNQLAEVLITELQSFGLYVVDAKATGNMQIGQNGDFVFTRANDQLHTSVHMDYVVSGTMIRHERGVQVNARIISLQSNVVLSSAKLTIPAFVVESLQPKYVLVE